MKDFPVFTTEYGVASLTLKEIPYRGIAYIRLLDSLEPEKLLEECISFCRVCGAERIYAAGHSFLEQYPEHCAVWVMRGQAEFSPDAIDPVFPVTEQTVGHWRQIYNEKMRQVDNATTLESRDEARILASAGTCFVHDRGELLGIGWVEDDLILAVASVKPGCGKRVMHALMSLACEETVTLEVASTNNRAIRLYESMGFVKVGEKERWYLVG